MASFNDPEAPTGSPLIGRKFGLDLSASSLVDLTWTDADKVAWQPVSSGGDPLIPRERLFITSIFVNNRGTAKNIELVFDFAKVGISFAGAGSKNVQFANGGYPLSKYSTQWIAVDAVPDAAGLVDIVVTARLVRV